MKEIKNNKQNILDFLFLLSTILVFYSCNSKPYKIEFYEENHGISIERGTMINGVKEGYSCTFDINDKDTNAISISFDSFYVKGNENGFSRLYYTNTGLLMSEGIQKDNIEDGLWTNYNEDGEVSNLGIYCNGKMAGIWEDYSPYYSTNEGRLDKRILYIYNSKYVLIDNHLSLSVPPPVPPPLPVKYFPNYEW